MENININIFIILHFARLTHFQTLQETVGNLSIKSNIFNIRSDYEIDL